MAITIQQNIKQHEDEQLLNYALFLGGLDVTHDVLASYDPFIGGKCRIFMTRVPTFMEKDETMRGKMKKFKHVLEYANTAIQGINNVEVQSDQFSGSYVGRQFNIPTIAKHNTNSLTISTYEFSGRPMGEVLHWWISGVVDFQSGFATYHGVDLEVKESNHTAEFIYVVTDRSGKSKTTSSGKSGVEFACMFADCFPTGIKMDHLNYRSGEANIADMDIEFTCTYYDGPRINILGAKLLEKHGILMDSLDFHPKFEVGSEFTTIDDGNGTHYDPATGMILPGAPGATT